MFNKGNLSVFFSISLINLYSFSYCIFLFLILKKSFKSFMDDIIQESVFFNNIGNLVNKDSFFTLSKICFSFFFLY